MDKIPAKSLEVYESIAQKQLIHFTLRIRIENPSKAWLF